jgi:hypothetical protein
MSLVFWSEKYGLTEMEFQKVARNMRATVTATGSGGRAFKVKFESPVLGSFTQTLKGAGSGASVLHEHGSLTGQFPLNTPFRDVLFFNAALVRWRKL